MTINAELQALSVSLNTDGSGERLALLGMQELVVDTLLSAEGGMMMKGQLGNLTAQDTYTVPGSPYEMLGLRAAEQSLLTFEYESPPDAARAASRARFEYDHVLRLKMSSVRVSYWHAAVMHTWDYLQSGVLGALVSATASTVVQAARSVLEAGTEASALALHVEVGSPLVLLPTAAGAADGLFADLGRIGVSNTLERKREKEGRAFGAAGVEASVFLDCIRVTVEQMQLSARGEGGEGGGDEAPGPVICACMSRPPSLSLRCALPSVTPSCDRRATGAHAARQADRGDGGARHRRQRDAADGGGGQRRRAGVLSPQAAVRRADGGRRAGALSAISTQSPCALHAIPTTSVTSSTAAELYVTRRPQHGGPSRRPATADAQHRGAVRPGGRPGDASRRL